MYNAHGTIRPTPTATPGAEVHEFHTRRWSLRYGSGAMPRVANGLRFDRRVLRDRGDAFEGEVRVKPGGHDARSAF